MHWLEHKVPPPVAAALAGLAMWYLARASGAVAMGGGLRLYAAAMLVLIGLACDLAGLYAFHRGRTTVNPLKPEAASSLVVGGVYRISRNPMYLGLAAMLLGWAVYLGAPLALLGPVLFVAFITRFQIVPEERVLARKFGPAFEAYCNRVRRWI